MHKWPGMSAKQSEKKVCIIISKAICNSCCKSRKHIFFTTSCFVQLHSSLEYQKYENGQDYVVVSLYFLWFAANEQDKMAKWECSVYIIWNVPNNAH